MPASVVAAAIAGFGGGSLFVAGASSIFSWSAFATSLVISAASNALARRQSVPSLTDPGRTVTTRQPVVPWRIVYGRCRIPGVIVYMTNAHPTEQSRQDMLTMAVVLAGHQLTSIDTVYFDDYALQLDANGTETGRYLYDGKVYCVVTKHLGDDNQSADGLLAGFGGWTTEHRLRGRAYLGLQIFFHPDLFPNGLPNISADVKGLAVYDPRTGLTNWSDNAALCLANYLSSSRYGLGVSYSTEIDQAALIAAANVCDELVALAAGGAERRYTMNGSFTTGATPKTIIQQMLTSMGGKLVYIGGRWRILPAYYVTPTITLGEADARAPLRIQSRLSRREGANRIKGLYVSEDNHWQPTDFPPVTNATYLAEDGGEPIWQELDLPFTTSAATAQRLAKIALERLRQQITIIMPCKLSAYRVTPGDVVLVDNVRMGWGGKPFEVIATTLSFDTDGTVGVDISLRETAAAVFDWNAGLETTRDPAPDTMLADPTSVSAPGVPQITEQLYQTTNSNGVKARAIISWSAGSDGFSRDFIVDWRQQGAASWNSIGPVQATTAAIDDIAPGVYEFRVRARSALGVNSRYSGTAVKEILGLMSPPAAVTGVSLVPLGAMAYLTWDAHADLDVRIGGRIEVRHSQALGAVWEEGTPIGSVFSGSATSGLAPLLAGTYLFKAVDSSGVYSQNAASVATTAPSVISFNAVATVTEHPAFPGIKTNLEVSANKLRLGALPNIDSLTDLIDTWSLVDSAGRTDAYTGSYYFDAGIDLGAVHVSRVTAQQAALAVDNSVLMDSHTEDIDRWESIDGTVVNDAITRLSFRTTDDDPAGSPAWSEWRAFSMGDYTARAYQFRLDFETADLSHNIEVSALGVTVDMPDRVESGSVVTGTGADTAVDYSKAFKAAPKVGLTVANMQSGDVIDIVSESTGGFTFNIRNLGVRVARTVNWIVKGY